MKPKQIRTSADPRNLHRIAAPIEQAIVPAPPKKGRLSLDHGLIRRTGKPISITNVQIYELGFP